jgi:cytochrome P450
MKFPRLIHDAVEVDEILKDRAWGMSMPALAPLLGDGVIMATGSHHTALRRQIGQMPPIADLHAIVRDFEPPQGPCDLGEQMTALVERVLGALFGDPDALKGAGRLVRKCVALAPFRLLGLPLDWWWLRKLNRLLAGLPELPWAQGESVAARRDWAANFVVAGIDTLSADLTAQLAGAKLLPIWWLPRKNVETGELVILLLSDQHKYGHGFRRCAGEHVAREMVRLVLRRFQVQLLPDESDLQPVGLITQRLAKVVGVMTRKDGGL